MTECHFSKVAVLVKTVNSDIVFQEHFATNHWSQQCYWCIYMEKTKFPEIYFVSNSFLKSLLFSVAWLSSDSGSSRFWITFSLKHFAETFQAKLLFTVIFSVYWLRKHCLLCFLKQYFPLPIRSYHVSRNIELTPLLYSTNIPFLSAFCSTFHTCTMSKGR